jgi:LacI family transcriptional regulator
MTIRSRGAARAPSTPPTSKDVARFAKVSQTTVSRVLSDSSAVREETRHRVLQAMEAIGYRPNIFARAMKTAQLGTVGVVVARLSNPIYPEILSYLGASLESAGKQMLMWQTETGGEEAALQAASQGLVDGVIFVAASAGSVRRIEETAARVPVVLVNRTAELKRIPQFAVDNFAGGRLVADYFLKARRRRPAMIAGDRTVSTVREREDGFRAVMEAAGHAPLLQHRVDFASYEQGYQAAERVIAVSQRPDAIFCVNDVIAFGCLDALRDKGLRVPEDVWVVGFDDVAMAGWSAFKLTTVHQPLREMAELAAQRLLQALSGEKGIEAGVATVPAHLVIRATTGETRPG